MRRASPASTVTRSRSPAAPPGAAHSLGHDLIDAKLLVPSRRPEAVRRNRLLRRLRSARDVRVVSIVAPPGYGKTSLLVEWASREPRAVAWVTVDRADNDPVVLLTYLAAAIDRVAPIEPSIFDSISSPAVSSRAVVGGLLAAIYRGAMPLLLVIDDAHQIADPGCLDAIAEFVTYLPEGSQVALAGREPPALPLARWRAQASLLELGPGDLAMDGQEVAGLARRLGFDLSPEGAAELAGETEGWPALLVLAIRQRGVPTGDGRPVAAGGDRHIADYLRSELLRGRPDAEVAFLTRTSILERLSGPVCDAVADRAGSAAVLAGLARSTILVDEYGGSYRYHALLRDFLQGEFAAREPSGMAAAHRRAADWYTSNGILEPAFDHAFAAADLDLAAAIAGRGLLRYHWSGRRATTRAWFGRFDEEALEQRPWLAVLAGWEELATGDVASTERLADVAERGTFEGRPPDGSASFASGRAMLRASMVRRGADDALANAMLAVEAETLGSPWCDFALWELAIALRMKGDLHGADEELADAIVAARSNRNAGILSCVLGFRALLAAESGDWNAASSFIAESEETGAPANLEGYLSTAPGRAARAWLAAHRGDITGARQDLAGAMRLRPLLSAACPGLAVLSLVGFARAHRAVGDPDGARALLAQAGQVIHRRPDLGVLPGEVAALRAAIDALPLGVGGASTLTAAELRVLVLLPYYLSFKEIGQRLGVKASTVKTHSIAIYGKLGASSRSEAVELAVAAGLIERFPLPAAASAIGEDAARRSG
jgi:LuxR family transcriptional regulator, maltose regulon positive regulatory protein